MKNVLITGSSGLLGSNLARHLMYHGYNVIGIDNMMYNQTFNTPRGLKQYEVNLGDHNYVNCKKCGLSLAEIFEKHKIDTVYHFASFACEGLSFFVPKFNADNVLRATLDIATQCIKSGSKLIYASSMAVYGDQSPPFTEINSTNPVDPYGICKDSCEKHLKSFSKMFGLEYTIVRPHNVGGVGQIQQGYRNVISIFIQQLINGENLTIFGDGEQTRAFSDVRYYLDPLEILGINNFNEQVFNIGADKFYSINELAEIVKWQANYLGLKFTGIDYLEKREEVKHAYCNHFKAKAMLGFEDRTKLDEMIKNMIIWNVRNRQENNWKPNIEISKNLYSFWK